MACIVMAHVLMAHVLMAYIVMAHVVMVVGASVVSIGDEHAAARRYRSVMNHSDVARVTPPSSEAKYPEPQLANSYGLYNYGLYSYGLCSHCHI